MADSVPLTARRKFWFAWPIAALLVLTTQAFAQESAHDKIRKSLVYLEASGLGTSGIDTGVLKETHATGFLVSDDGYILTTYHLVSGLMPVVSESIVFRANVGEKVEVLKYTASLHNSIPELDLLLLKMSQGIEPLEPVKLGTLKEARTALEVYTSGFPEIGNYRRDNGTIESKDTLSYLWEVNDMPFAFGQSGSPVYTADGTVVGMAKGQLENAPGVNFIIPIQVADPLLAAFRFSDLDAQIAGITGPLANIDVNRIDLAAKQLKTAMENIEEIASNIDWSASVDDDEIRLSYKKLANVGPQVEFVAVRATPLFKEKDGKSVNVGTMIFDFDRDGDADLLVPEEFNQKTRLGEVIVPNLFQKIRSMFCYVGLANEMNGIRVDIAASLKGGVQLAPVTIQVDKVLNRKGDCYDFQ